jgi:hypothetical protein
MKTFVFLFFLISFNLATELEEKYNPSFNKGLISLFSTLEEYDENKLDYKYLSTMINKLIKTALQDKNKYYKILNSKIKEFQKIKSQFIHNFKLNEYKSNHNVIRGIHALMLFNKTTITLNENKILLRDFKFEYDNFILAITDEKKYKKVNEILDEFEKPMEKLEKELKIFLRNVKRGFMMLNMKKRLKKKFIEIINDADGENFKEVFDTYYEEQSHQKIVKYFNYCLMQLNNKYKDFDIDLNTIKEIIMNIRIKSKEELDNYTYQITKKLNIEEEMFYLGKIIQTEETKLMPLFTKIVKQNTENLSRTDDLIINCVQIIDKLQRYKNSVLKPYKDIIINM